MQADCDGRKNPNCGSSEILTPGEMDIHFRREHPHIERIAELTTHTVRPQSSFEESNGFESDQTMYTHLRKRIRKPS